MSAQYIVRCLIAGFCSMRTGATLLLKVKFALRVKVALLYSYQHLYRLATTKKPPSGEGGGFERSEKTEGEQK